MNLQETIKRVLKEDREQKMISLIKTSIRPIMKSYDRICGVDILTPSENADRYYFLSQRMIPYRVLVYIVGGVDSEYWPRTQAVYEKEMDIIDEMHNTIRAFLPINVEVKIEYVKSCKEYKNMTDDKDTLNESKSNLYPIMRRTNLIDDEVKKLLNNVYIGQYLCVNYRGGDELINVISHAVIENLYFNTFYELDDESEQWQDIAQFIFEYVPEKFGKEIRKHYERNCD